MATKNITANVTMEELLASHDTQNKLQSLYRGQEIEGEVLSVTDKEIILDLGTKSEGVLATRDVPPLQLKSLKSGDRIKAFVYIPENESGQVILSYDKQAVGMRLEGPKGRFHGDKSKGRKSIDWTKFVTAQRQKSQLQGKVIELNKGGLIVEAGGVRGFLPNSQVGFELMSKSGDGLEALIGQDLTLTIIEVDQNNNKLIFSERGQVSAEIQARLREFKVGQKVKGKIVAILPFGLVVDVAGVEGLVFISDVSWDKVEDLSKLFTAGEELEVLVIGLDEELGRLNLSIKQLTEDPFAEKAKQFSVDEVVKGEIIDVSESGVSVSLDEAEGLALSTTVEGFLPASKMDPDARYEAGKSMSFLVDSVDSSKRRINLAPFVTSTAGLIYK